MPEPQNIGIDTSIHSKYLNQDRSVSIQKALEAQQQKQKGGLNGVEVRNTPQQLGKNDFLKLLITQLTYQDPTSPVKDQHFIAQMAQFSSLEQMQNMASSIGRLADNQAYGLIGRYVAGNDFVSGERIGGIAEAVFRDENGKTFLKAGGRAIALDQVQMIGDPALIQKTQKTQEFPKKHGAANDTVIEERRAELGKETPLQIQKQALKEFNANANVIQENTHEKNEQKNEQ